jgi:hypothetical protein
MTRSLSGLTFAMDEPPWVRAVARGVLAVLGALAAAFGAGRAGACAREAPAAGVPLRGAPALAARDGPEDFFFAFFAGISA